jgi:hypothetical protein
MGKNDLPATLPRPRSAAARADRLALYEASVQDTASDIQLIETEFMRQRRRRPLRLREDFCGTAKLCADWVRGQPDRFAVGIDLHAPTLDWGRRHHLLPLGDEASRVRLLCRDVRQGVGESFDVIVAFNFSYSVLTERRQLLAYLRRVCEELGEDGALFLDLYGGPDAQVIVAEEQAFPDFTYVWDQEGIDAVTGRGKRHIHYRFADGSELRRAFTYDWRLWSLPELRDLLDDAGFADSDVLWEDADAEGNGTGVFRRVRAVANEQSWVAYLVGWR